MNLELLARFKNSVFSFFFWTTCFFPDLEYLWNNIAVIDHSSVEAQLQNVPEMYNILTINTYVHTICT